MDEEQWGEFLQVTQERFGIEFDQLDSDMVTGLSKERGTEIQHFEGEIEHYDLTIGVTFSDLGLAEKFVDSLKKIIPKWPAEASWTAPGAPRCPKRGDVKFHCCILSHLGPPPGGAGGLGGLWGGPWAAVGPSWRVFWRSEECWGCLRSGLGGRSGRKLDKHTLLGRMLTLF